MKGLTPCSTSILLNDYFKNEYIEFKFANTNIKQIFHTTNFSSIFFQYFFHCLENSTPVCTFSVFRICRTINPSFFRHVQPVLGGRCRLRFYPCCPPTNFKYSSNRLGNDTSIPCSPKCLIRTSRMALICSVFNLVVLSIPNIAD